MNDEPTELPRPVLRIVNGSATPEELAVLTAIVSARGGRPDEDVSSAHRGAWSDPAARHRRALIPGHNGWRSAACRPSS